MEKIKEKEGKELFFFPYVTLFLIHFFQSQDPDARPPMGWVLTQCQELRKKLPKLELRAKLYDQKLSSNNNNRGFEDTQSSSVESPSNSKITASDDALNLRPKKPAPQTKPELK